MFVYGVFAGLVPSSTTIGPVPVELFRGLCALAILHFIMYGLDVFLAERDEEITARLERAARAERLASLGRMATGVAHEINTPLANVSLQLEMLARDLEGRAAGPQARRRLDIIREGVERSTVIARELLLFAGPGGKTPDGGRCDLRTAVDKAWRLLSPRNGAYRLETDLAPECLELHADAGRIEEVFVNLFLNAMDAMPDGGRIEVGCRREGRDLTVTVRDHGHGIAPEDRDRVMEPFFTTRETGRGTGLGLSICHGIMESHGGGIAVDSVPGRGTVVTLRFPDRTEED